MRHGLFVGVSLLLLVLTNLLYTPLHAAQHPAAPQIRLRYASFDPLTEPPTPPTLYTPALAAWQPRLWIVQFHQPVQAAWQDHLHATTTAQIFGALPDYALLVRMDAATAALVGQSPLVRWVGEFLPVYRIDPLFFERPIDPTTPLDLTISALPDAKLGALLSQLAEWRGVIYGTAATSFARYISVRLPVAYVPHVAALPDVVWVEAADELALHTQRSGAIIRADVVRSGLRLTGANQIVAVADSGLDTGNTATLHPDLRGRIVRTFALGRMNDWSDPTGHGTHMIGTVAGSGLLSGSDPATGRYTGTYTGVAPAASVIVQSIGDATGGIGGVPLDRGALMRQAYQFGARIHSNSWGGHTGGLGNPPDFGRYTISSRQVDAVAWEFPDLLILYSAGNEGRDDNRDGIIDADGITQPGTAKNALTVGASENEYPTIGRTYGNAFGSPIARDLYADNRNGMAAFSSRGPTDDGRIKPDLVAPGTFIAAARTQAVLFDDNLERSLQAYQTWQRDNGAGTWQAAPQQGRNNSTAWAYAADGTFPTGTATYLLSPPFSVAQTTFFDIIFWHRYQFGANNRGEVLLFSRHPSDPNRIASSVIPLPMTGTRSDYSQVVLENISVSSLRRSGIDPTRLQIGFAVTSTTDTINSQWWLDDLRVDAADWGTLGKYRMTARGSGVDEAYVMLGGTSSATALTAGAAALAREWLTTTRNVANPSAALLKALLINGAADMSPGQYSDRVEVPAQRPNGVSGWGRIDLAAALQTSENRRVWFIDQTDGVSTSMAYTYTFEVGASSSLDVTLAWTDFPGYETASKALVNDLDLLVLAPDGRRIVGNQGLYTGGQCLRGGQWDACNNVEGVRLSNAPAGTYRVVVRGIDVTQGRRQPFALVVAGTGVTFADPQAPSQSQPHTVFLPFIQRQ